MGAIREFLVRSTVPVGGGRSPLTLGCEKMMKHVSTLTRSGQSFAERCGAPDEFDAAMGKIAVNFAYMEEIARHLILFLSGTEPDVGQILTVELSFRQKLEAIGSLVHHHLQRTLNATTRDSLKEEIEELISLCQKAEELRNMYLHSSYALDGTRTKVTAKRKHGLRASSEVADSALLLDVADFIHEAAAGLSTLPITLCLADSMTEDGIVIIYTLKGKEQGRYHLGR